MEMIFGLVFTAISIGFLVKQFFPTTTEEVLVNGGGEISRQPRSEETKLFSLFYPLIKIFLPIVSSLPIGKSKNKLQRLLISAGLDEEITPDIMISFQWVLAIILPLVLNAFISLQMAIPVGIIIGLMYPLIWLYDKKNTRQAEIVRSLPGRVDLLALSMEAGLDFNSSVKQIIDQYPNSGGGPMIQELRVFIQNMRLGMSRNEALEELSTRVDDAEVYSFISVLVQADVLGASVGDTLKQQGKKLREERFMKAERLGAAASQKMMIPMMLFIFPLMFAVIFAPFLIKMFYGQ